MVNEERVSIVYNGNGKTKVFDYPYSFTKGSEIVGYVNNGKTITRITSNFTFNSQLKKYTYPTSGNAIPAGHTLMLIRKTERSNLVDLPNDSPFSAIERQFDKIARTLQELGESDGMGKTMTVLSNDFNAIIPKGKPYAYIRFNSDATAFEVIDNPFEVGESQLKEIREIKNTIETLQRAMDKSINNLNGIKEEFDTTVADMQGTLNTMETQFANQLESKLENSLDAISKQEQSVVDKIADKAEFVNNSIKAAVEELESIKREVIDEQLVEIRRLSDNASNSAVAAQNSYVDAANSASDASDSANRASKSALAAAKSANAANNSATVASNQAISAEESATRAKTYADQATDISGGHFVTTTEFDTYKQSASNNVDTAITNHNQSANAHANIVRVINNSLGLKADKTEVESLNYDITNHIGEVVSTHDNSEDAHYNIFSKVAEQLDSKASKTELNTMRDNVNNSLALKASTSTVNELKRVVDTKASSTQLNTEVTNLTTKIKDVADTVQAKQGVIEQGYDINTGNYWRKWSNNWGEQGGIKGGAEPDQTITFHKPFRYLPIITVTPISNAGRRLQLAGNIVLAIRDISTTGCNVSTSTFDLAGYYWKAEGELI